MRPPRFRHLCTQGKMSDRSSKTSFAVSRNLKNAKNYFIEAKMYKLTESVIPPQNLFQHQRGYVCCLCILRPWV